VAQKRRKKKRGWLRAVLLFFFVPVCVWVLAFLIWFNWTNSKTLFPAKKSPAVRPSQRVEKENKQAGKSSGEKIHDEDRKKLDEILKNRG
jgi:hypothetical protein